MASMKEIVSIIGIGRLNFVNQPEQKDDPNEADIPTSWFKCWDNTTRTMVTAHKDVLDAAKKDKQLVSLFLKTTNEVGPEGAYTKHIVCKQREVAYSFSAE